jgi:hypothetical protein
MAAVIHVLWERQDTSLLILPASVPIDDSLVQYELTRYLEDPWTPIIERDVDGPHSLPLRLDREHPNLGRFSATRRVARTIYMGSAPTLHTANRGIEEQRIKLGCVQPGESVATFGDALRRLTEQANHIYVQDKRYWYSTQPSVTRLAQDRAVRLDRDVVLAQIEQRLRVEQGTRGSFARIHVCPASSGEVPDERDARLVILRPAYVHTAKDVASSARAEAAAILEQRSTSPRYYANTLVFMVADRTRLEELEQAARQYLAWKSIEDEQEILNLDAFQRNQARSRREHAEGTIKARIPETYSWLLVPESSEDSSANVKVSLREIRLQAVQEPLAVRASRKLENDGLLLTKYAGTTLRLELDKVPLWRGESVSVKQLADDFAQYLYLPRLRDTDVLLAAVRDGIAALNWERETFAYADSYDATRQRYLGLKIGQQIIPSLEGVLVKPEVAAAQITADMASSTQSGAGSYGYGSAIASSAGQRQHVADGGAAISEPTQAPPAMPPRPQPQRFYGSVTLDTTRAVRDATAVIEEVAQHLSGLLGTRVEITMEIHAELPEGAPEHIVRTVTENCRTLKFTNYGFEKG